MITFLQILTVACAFLGVLTLFMAIGDFHVYRKSLRELEDLQEQGSPAYRIDRAKEEVESNKEETIFTAKVGVGLILWPLGLLFVIYHLFRKDGPMTQYYADFKTLFH